MRRREPQGFYLDIPHAGPQVQKVVTTFVGIADYLRIALTSRDRSAGDGLVGGKHIAAFLRGI